MTDDWFRSPDWTPDAQADFEERLRRARPYNRAQYLRIKGLALNDAGLVDAARSLWLRVLDNTDELARSQQASALEHLADSYAANDATTAERYYRRLLAEHPTLNGTSHTVEIALAELLVKRGNHASMDEATALLNAFLERGVAQFPSVLFRWQLVLIDIALAMGEKDTAQQSARTALDLAAREPVFPRHKTVGVVRTDQKTLRRLKRLARI